jgi:hypothetical protein
VDRPSDSARRLAVNGHFHERRTTSATAIKANRQSTTTVRRRKGLELLFVFTVVATSQWKLSYFSALMRGMPVNKGKSGPIIENVKPHVKQAERLVRFVFRTFVYVI